MNKQRMTQVIIVFAFIVLFELAARLELLDTLTFIPFSEMVISSIHLVTDTSFFKDGLIPTAIATIISFVASSVLGIIVGIILWRSEFLYRSFQPYLMLVYAIPLFAIYPVFINLFGAGITPIVVLSTLFAIPSVISNTAIGFRSTRKVLKKVGESLNLSSSQMLFHIYIPSAWPQIFTGMKLALAYSIICVIATEFILSTHGLGHTISFAYNNFELDEMYGSILIIIAIVFIINGFLRFIETFISHEN